VRGAIEPLYKRPMSQELAVDPEGLSFASLANELPVTTTSTETSFAWEQIRANWTRRPEGGPPPGKIQPSGGRSVAVKLVQGGSISTPVRLDDLISCLLSKWEEEAEDQ
jgi:hypothetical protein